MPSEWDIKSKYETAFEDTVIMRITVMKFLLEKYGIDVVKEYFLEYGPECLEKLRVGKLKKTLINVVSKLAKKQVLKKLTDILIENVQYIVDLKHVWIGEPEDNTILINVTKCPFLKRFKKLNKKLGFELEERYICTFSCIPMIRQMLDIGNCDLRYSFFEKGCKLTAFVKSKQKAEDSENNEQ